MATTKHLTVEVVNGDLRSGIAALEDAASQKRERENELVAAAQRDLAPVVAEARELLDHVLKLRGAHGRDIERLFVTDFRGLQLRYGLPENLVRRLERLVADARDFLVAAESELAEVPVRVAKLTPADLARHVFPRLSFQPEGVYPAEPTHIRATVANYRAGVKTFAERLIAIETLVEELRRRIEGHTPWEVTTVARVDDDDDASERALGPAVAAFDVFEHPNPKETEA